MLSLGLAGCASMSEDECRRADWTERGLRDGVNGQTEFYISAHREACAKAGVLPDERRWRAGWSEGILSFCVPQVAWRLGLEGRSYNDACRSHDQAGFVRWHTAGKDVYTTRQERDRTTREIERLEEQLKKAKTEDERKSTRERIRQLDAEQARLRRLHDVQMKGAPP